MCAQLSMNLLESQFELRIKLSKRSYQPDDRQEPPSLPFVSCYWHYELFRCHFSAWSTTRLRRYMAIVTAILLDRYSKVINSLHIHAFV